MEEPVQPFAWQPITFGGVARFAHAPRNRLLLVQFLVALLCAGAITWCLHQAWFPVITAAIGQVPDQGELRGRRLSWLGQDPARLAENRFLALSVDLTHSGALRAPAHLQLEFGLADIEVRSLFGYAWLPYPRQAVPINRVWLTPWWGAWSPVILALTAGLVVAGLMLTWAVLASVYCVPVWILGFFANRELALGHCWNLAGTALLPGALVMSVAIVLYGLGTIEVIGLLVGASLHFLIGWIYLAVSPFKVRQLTEFAAGKKNPFAPAAKSGGETRKD